MHHVETIAMGSGTAADSFLFAMRRATVSLLISTQDGMRARSGLQAIAFVVKACVWSARLQPDLLDNAAGWDLGRGSLGFRWAETPVVRPLPPRMRGLG